MNLLSAVWGFFTGGSSTANKVVDGALSGIDKIFYTDEEKADARAKLGDQWLELQKVLGEESTARAVTRRILAVLIVVPFVVISAAAAPAYYFNKDYASFLVDLAEGTYGTLTLMVAAFYFAPYMIGQAMQAFKKPAQLPTPPDAGNGN